VPSDNFLINAHAAEAVMPASVASPMRTFFENGAGQQGGSGGGNNISVGVTMTVGSPTNGSFPQMISQYSKQLARAVVREMNTNPSLRPNY
jgi:hypothetical protein